MGRLAAILTAALVAAAVTFHPRAEIRVTTFSGDSYIAGTGDTCPAAWEGARIPSNWHSITCRETR